jgi:hypothetical protein
MADMKGFVRAALVVTLAGILLPFLPDRRWLLSWTI